jgi:hypothetical protein
VPTTQRQRWAELLFFVVVVAVIFFASRHQLFLDPGTFWHTRTGELILERGFIDQDPFSYTYGGQTWIPSQWLAEVGMALLHRLLELDALMWAAITIIAGLLAWIGGRFVRAGCHPLLAALFVALAFLCSCYHYHTRPHLLTMVLLSGLCAFLLEVDAGRQPLRRLWWLLPVFILWTNLHGGMLAGLGTFGLCGIGWGVLFLLKQPSPLNTWKDVGELALLGVLCGLTAFINPYGWRLPWMWWVIMKADLPQIIMEHKPLDPLDEVGLAVLSLTAIYLFFLFGLRVRPRVSWLLPLVWFVLAWTRVRNGPLFSFITLLAIADMLPHTRWMQWVAGLSDIFVIPGIVPKHGSPYSPTPAEGLFRLPLYLWLIPVLFLCSWLFGSLVILDRRHWPLDLKDAIRAEVNRTPNARFFHEDLYGGFLIYYFPDVPVFLDDRCELFVAPLPGRDRKPLLLDFAEAQSNDPARFEIWAKEFGFTHALTRNKRPDEAGAATTPAEFRKEGFVLGTFTRYLMQSPDWELVGDHTPAASLFRRKSMPQKKE